MNATVIWLTWRQLFVKSRLIVAILFSLASVLITLVFSISAADPGAAAEGFLGILYKEIVIGTILPLAAVVFGTSAFGGEVDDGTLIYLLIKPLARWKIVVSKYVVALLATAVVATVAIMGPWLLVRTPELTIGYPAAYLYGALAGSVLYAALFITLGINSRRALVVGLLYVIAFEAVMSRNMQGLKSLSIREFSLTIAQRIGEFPGGVESVTMGTVYTVGSVIFFGSLLLATYKVHKYEMAERL